MKILAKHKWVSGATITESCDSRTSIRRFTATIRGFRNWKIYEGELYTNTARAVKRQVEIIRDAIDKGDDWVFSHKGYFLRNL